MPRIRPDRKIREEPHWEEPHMERFTPRDTNLELDAQVSRHYDLAGASVELNLLLTYLRRDCSAFGDIATHFNRTLHGGFNCLHAFMAFPSRLSKRFSAAAAACGSLSRNPIASNAVCSYSEMNFTASFSSSSSSL